MEGTRDLYFTHGNGSGCRSECKENEQESSGDHDRKYSTENLFSDVSRSDYYAEAIAWAKAQGIAAGYDDGSFGPADTITRAQMVSFMCRVADKFGKGVTADNVSKIKFKDVKRRCGWIR